MIIIDIEESDTSPVHQIDIVFDIEDIKDIEGPSCKTPLISGESGNCDNGEYITHPTFITLGVNGIWVCKFETGYLSATTKEEVQINEFDSSKIIINPISIHGEAIQYIASSQVHLIMNVT